ncbi:MAG: hypothetical protein IPL73_23695 [Candidatus Obscuribacter sp.]|nr:hypothetical protein [Candidatus Obscuribacter sp.]MBK9622576.1 hypothetical protein [Candidatus Obscuribacter sp.]
MDKDYGLELTNNSKASWAFSLPRSETCIGATDICKTVCYGNGIRYQTTGQRAKRQRNFRTVELLLSKGGPELLAENLVSLIDQVKPADSLSWKRCCILAKFTAWCMSSQTGSQFTAS